jgi:ABC-type sugar transport system substrate-binding protein
MKKRHYGALSVALVALLVSACSSGGKTTSASTGGTSSSQSGGASTLSERAYVAKAKAFVAAHLKEAPFDAGSAFTPTPGKTIGIVSASQEDPIDVKIAAATQEAATAVGWKSVVLDGKGTPGGWNAAIQQFVQQKVDGIVDDAVADSAVPAALAAASAAHIPVISVGAGTLASKPIAHPSFASVDLPLRAHGADGRQ